ncbi:MAG: cupredoxin domain-containing protein [Bacteroidetes bacterium]|nr:cupredoxin domain-containing protein [Bacteroidota bacterium]
MPTQVKLLPGTMNNSELFPKQLDVIIGYNNTIKFTNLDDVPYSITADYGEFETGLIKPNETASFTIYNPGTYDFYAKPWLTGTITVLDP